MADVEWRTGATAAGPWHVPRTIQAPETVVPEDKRTPFGWKTVAVLPWDPGGSTDTVHSAASDRTTLLRWDPIPMDGTEARFRITVALDVRENLELELFLGRSGRVLGRIDIRYAYVLQPFEWIVPLNEARAILREGLGLRLVRGSHLVVFGADPAHPTVLSPHLYVRPADPEPLLQAFESRMLSRASLQPFSWMEGCVLDGMLDLAGKKRLPHAWAAAKEHLSHFFDEEGRLVYEDPRSRPADGRIYGIEGTLPMAALARIHPDHPALDAMLDFFKRIEQADGTIQDGGTLSAEGSYTVAYPLAVIAGIRQDRTLAERAVRQLLIRQDRLTDGADLFLRAHEDGSRTFKNWARAYAWYMLGLIRSWRELVQADLIGDTAKNRLAAEMRRIGQRAVERQQANGLWTCYLDDPDSGTDTSGSAGIAAALAMGCEYGVLPVAYEAVARQALDGLQRFLTPDGLLTGSSQSNRGGDALQRGGYRVISQMAMGLMGQLLASMR